MALGHVRAAPGENTWLFPTDHGEGYQLTGHDILTARKFPDAIARGAYPVDIHDPESAGTILRRVPRGGGL